ncbi:MAG: hypothetical protein M3487_02830 [Actinomycetota bacterium]|nr:hypothetical protein [Acidimicrobiia bacterium]MDQ3468700.1 hypothetical protein [Actinomycetota bacterium]
MISTLTILAAACGDDDVESPAATASADTAATTQPSPATTAAVSGYVHASGAEDVVIEIGFEGGFVPVEIAFTRVPNLLVTGDGRAIETGPVIAIFPGPLLPNLQQRSISEAAVQTLLARADELGLLADIQYARNDLIADAPDTVVRISVDRATYEHRAYALGLGEGGETDAARVNLAEFAAAAADLAGTVGEAELGPQAPFDGEEYLVRATPVGPGETAGGDVEPTIVEWPPASSVRLADASDCAVVLPGEGDALFVNATQLTFFADAGVTYRVAAIGRLPGRGC